MFQDGGWGERRDAVSHFLRMTFSACGGAEERKFYSLGYGTFYLSCSVWSEEI